MNVDWTVIVIGVFLVYYGIVEWLKAKGKLEKYGISAFWFILMIRTSKGLKLLEKISKCKRFWRWIANLGIPAVFIGMIFMFTLIILMDIAMVIQPPEPSRLTEPRNVLLIPGVNEFIPLIWGLIALVITLIIHEFSHAILSMVEGVRVKSLGILLALVPIGGFAEPDEEELMGENAKTTRIQRIRIFSAGVISNFIAAIIAFTIFIYLLGSLTSNGVYINAIYEGFPGDEAGIEGGMVIVKINDVETPNIIKFREVMGKTKPGETVKIHAYGENGTVEEFMVNLTKFPNGDEKGFIGVEVIDAVQLFKDMPSRLTSVGGWLMAISMPFTFFGGFSGIFTEMYEPSGIWANMGNTLFYLLNLLYWVGWINFYVGLFNCLPAIPIDGGRVFYESLTKFMSEKMAMNVVKFFAFLVFFSIILAILIPNLGKLI